MLIGLTGLTVLFFLAHARASDGWQGHVPSDGWTPGKDTCVDICAGQRKAVCFNSTCANKTAERGDLDYLMMDLIWLPQFCRDLANGQDITITHPETARCVDEVANQFSIHGLWAQYVGGYPACCGGPNFTNTPLNPASLDKALVDRLSEHWHDPTDVAAVARAPCFMWNHEWQKHGTCGLWAGPRAYLEHTMDIVESQPIANAMATLNDWGSVGTEVTLVEIHALLPHRISVTCSPLDSHEVSAFRLCLDSSISSTAQIDCPGISISNCNTTAPIRLSPWLIPNVPASRLGS